MNYRHGYHAGNFADVVKHLALVAMAGIYLPPVLVTGFTNVAKLLG